MKFPQKKLAFVLVTMAMFSQIRNVDAANVMFALRTHPDKFEETGIEGDMISEGDAAQIALFEGWGHTLEFWDNAQISADGTEALFVADESDLVYVSESISSGRMAALADTSSPLISNENYGCDSLGITWQEANLGRVDGHGSPGTLNPDGWDLLAGTSFGTELRIVDDAHPIAAAAGLSNGDFAIYDSPGGRRSWCTPGPDGIPNGEAQIVAVLPEFVEDFPNAAGLLVYEAGSTMADGREAPAMRIASFLSDTNRGPELADPSLESDGGGPAWEATLLTDAGKKLLEASVNYALGIEVTGNPLDLNGDNVVNADDVDLACGTGSSLDPYFTELNSLAADLDFDGTVGFSDFLSLSGNFGKAEQSYSGGDVNCDSMVDFADFLVLSGAFGKTAGGAATASVPEPSGLSLLLFGMLIAARRRR